MLDSKPNTQLKILGIFFLLLFLFKLIQNIYANAPRTSLWFCTTFLLIIFIGLYFNNLLILSSSIVSLFIIETLWVIDLIYFSFSGKLIIGIASYLFTLSPSEYILTFYHFFSLLIPIYIVFSVKKFHKNAWILSSLHLLILSILTISLTKVNINCVRSACEMGIFNFLYYLKPPWLPFIFFQWIGITLIIFIPTNLLFNKLIKISEDKENLNNSQPKHLNNTTSKLQHGKNRIIK
tara:strand:- start:131 stop:838 length:708 start_codon:yes stop_codon:yes gene_type:complete